MGIECSAVVIDRSKTNQITYPVLLFSENNGGEFFLIRDIQRHFEKRPDLLEAWNGIIVVAQKGADGTNTGNKQRYIKERRQIVAARAFMACLLLLPVCLLWNRLSPDILLLWMVNLAGIGIGSIIVLKKFGYTSQMTDRLCNSGGQGDCDAIIHSRRSRLNQWLDWSDIGIIYFASVCMLQIQGYVAGIDAGMTEVLAVLSLCALPFTLFSVYYQWWIVKKWCILCLFVVVVLWVTEGVLLPRLIRSGVGEIRVADIAIAAGVFLFLAGVWLIFVKPFLSGYSLLRDGYLPLKRFKRDPNILIALLEKGRSVDITPFEHDLQLGNPSAPLQLLVICQPYCAPCAKAHVKLNKILAVHGDSIGVTIRFIVNAEQQNDNRTSAVRYILQYWLEKAEHVSGSAKAVVTRQVLDHWFEHMNYEIFTKNNVVSEARDINALLSRHGHWCAANRIRATPTIFLQGKELPSQYDLNELNHFIPNVLEVITHPGSHPQIA
jgi:uncharacterized membrane protein